MARKPFIDVHLEQDEATVIVRVAGEVDLATAPTLEERLDEVLRSEPKAVVVDLLQVAFLDSSGLSALLRAHDLAADRSRLLLVVGEGVVDVVLRTTAMDEVFTITRSVEEALAAL